MACCNSDKIFDVFIFKRVEDHFSFFSLFDESQGLEHPHLVRNGRLADADEFGDVQDAQFFPLQSKDDFETGRIAQNLEGFRQVEDILVAEDCLSGGTYRILMIVSSWFQNKHLSSCSGVKISKYAMHVKR